MAKVRIILRVVGCLLIFFGIVWFFQGIGVLPGSFMTGQTKWAVYGSITAAVGLGVLIVTRRRRSRPSVRGSA